MLELLEVQRFDENPPGWFDWHGSNLRNLRAVEFSFFANEEEVARARIYPMYRLEAPYEGLRAGTFVNLDLLVVRDHLRRQRFGLEAVQLLVSRYQGQTMIAFSAADHFWDQTGWARAVRNDGGESAMTLFVY